MKLHAKTPYESKMCPFDFGVKGQGQNALITGNGKCHTIASFYTYHHETSYKDSPWVEDVPFRFWGQKVKGQGHNALITENGKFRTIAFSLQLSSWSFTQTLHMSWWCALLIVFVPLGHSPF